MRMARVAVVVLAALSLPVLARAQDKPNFTGKWKLNAEKSDFGGIQRPDSAGYVIRHSGANLSLDYTQDGHNSHVDIISDGDERVTESNPDTEIWTRVFWAGPVLTFESRQKARPAHESPGVRWTSRWSLSPDGKVLIIQKHFTSPDGELTQKLVFDKQ